ncbi:MAG: hypothetical protein J2O38_04965, partial [Acidimicrobiales bacterium]|nr:hypothetical protein [Acidimicrobiales bacterium]
FTSRLASAVESRLVLRQADRADYVILGLDARAVPRQMPSGRAIWAETGTEVQVAVLSGDASDGAQAEQLSRIARRWSTPPDAERPRRVDPLPVWAEMPSLERSEPRGATVTLGVGGDELSPVDVDLAEVGPGFLVSGPARSGRSTALACVIESLPDGRAVVVCPRRSPLRELCGRPSVSAVLSGTGPELGEAVAAAVSAVGAGAVVVIDDAELIGDGPAARVLEGLVRDARDSGVLIVAAATTDDVLLSRYRGWLADLRRSRAGLLLTPTSAADGEVFDLRLPRDLDRSWPPGRALLAVRGETMPLQVAVPGVMLAEASVAP